MRIAFLVRSSFEDKSGGDVMNVRFLADEMEQLGHHVTIVGDVKQALAFGPQVVVLINLDLPVENLLFMRQITRDIPIFIITIAHPHQGMKDYFQYSSDRFVSLARLFTGWERAWVVKEIIKLRKISACIYAFRKFTKLQAQVLRRTSAVIALSARESEFIAQKFGQTATTIYNGFEVPQEKLETRHPMSVLVVGRIEPRKNQALVAQALAGTAYDVTFIGSLNENHPKYNQQFLATVEQQTNLKYLGPVGHKSVLDQLAHCAVYLNLAWFEVTSNADMEASVMGSRVITTTNSWDDRVTAQQLDPREVFLNHDLLIQALAKESTAKSVIQPVDRSWKSAALEFETLALSILPEH